jgi:hypothetical protein
MTKRFLAFMAVLWCLLIQGKAAAAPPALQQIDSDVFSPSWVHHEPGSSTITVYGLSNRAGSVDGSYDLARLRANDGGVSNTYSFGWVTGGNTTADEGAMLVCPIGSFCAGKALYLNAFGVINKCDLVGDALSGCSSVPAFDQGGGLALTPTQIISARGSIAKLYLIDPVTGSSTPMSATCSPAGKYSFPAGLAGAFLYLTSDRTGTLGSDDIFRINWNGSDCTGSATNLNSPGTGYGPINTAGVEYGAIDPLTGSVYKRDWDTDFPFVAKKEKSCGDGFIEEGEDCDPQAKDVYSVVPDHNRWRLNAQTCLSIPGGFTGGTLACNPVTCKFDTSACTLAASCGDGVKNGAELCDGSDFGSATCASIKGAGWTGSLSCTGGCGTIDSSTCTPPAATCGDGVKNGVELCDGSDLGSASCTSVPGGFSGGTLACSGSCTFNTSGCYKCGDGVKNGTEACDGSDFGSATCASIKGAGWTGPLSCSACASIISSACMPPAPICGNGIKEAGEECDPPEVGSCTVLGEGYSGTPGCSGSCTITYDSCTPPETCGNGVVEGSEQCDGSPAGKTCETEVGPGYTGALSCSSCTINKTACSFDWGFKNLVGACYMSGNHNQTIVFTGGACSAEYWPVGALSPTKVKWKAIGSTQIVVAVKKAGEWTKVYVPYGVDHEEVVDNGNKYELFAGGGTSLGVGGTIYSQKWLSPEIWRATCTEGFITFSATVSGAPASGLNVDGTPGKLPSSYGVELNVNTNTVTTPPWLLSSGTGGSGGTGGDAGAGGEAGSGGSGGDAGTAGQAGNIASGGSGGSGQAGQAGQDVGGNPANGDGGDDGSCSIGGHIGKKGNYFTVIFIAGLVLVSASRRRTRG